MTQCIALKPMVFSLQGTPELPDYPALKGCRCSCGFVFFPRQHYGCEMCGRSQNEIEDIEIAGKGRLRAFATVHRSTSENRKVPYVVATIVMDAGCTIRSLLEVTNESQLSPGQAVYSTLTVVGNEKGRDVVDLRFTPRGLNC